MSFDKTASEIWRDGENVEKPDIRDWAGVIESAVGAHFKDVQAMIDDNTLTYTVGYPGLVSVRVGDVIITSDNGGAYEVVASNEALFHRQTYGGVKVIGISEKTRPLIMMGGAMQSNGASSNAQASGGTLDVNPKVSLFTGASFLTWDVGSGMGIFGGATGRNNFFYRQAVAATLNGHADVRCVFEAHPGDKIEEWVGDGIDQWDAHTKSLSGIPGNLVNATIQENVGKSMSGENTGDKLTETAAFSAHYQVLQMETVAGEPCLVSFGALRSGTNHIAVGEEGGSQQFNAGLSLLDGTIVTNGADLIDAWVSSEDPVNGYYEFSIMFTAQTTGTLNLQLRLIKTAGSVFETYVGDASDGVVFDNLHAHQIGANYVSLHNKMKAAMETLPPVNRFADTISNTQGFSDGGAEFDNPVLKRQYDLLKRLFRSEPWCRANTPIAYAAMEVSEAGNPTNVFFKSYIPSDGDLFTMMVPVEDVPAGEDGVHWTGLGHDIMGMRFWEVLSGRRSDSADYGIINAPYVRFRLGSIFGESLVAKRDANGIIYFGTGSDATASAQSIGSPYFALDPGARSMDGVGLESFKSWDGGQFVETLALSDPENSGELSATFRGNNGVSYGNYRVKFGPAGSGPGASDHVLYITI